MSESCFRAGAWLALALIVAGVGAPTAHGFIRGDANDDGTVDIGDPVRMLGSLFTPGEPPIDCLDAGDSNDDGTFDIADAVYVLNYLFVGGSAAPPEPFPLDGVDPTPDPLGDCDVASLPFTVLAEGTYCGAPDTFTIFRDATEFEAFWSGFAGIFFPPPPLPAVDFSTEMVVAVVQNYTSGGFFIEIDEIVVNGLEIEVHYTAGAPLSGCPTTDALTAPHSIVVVPNVPGDPVPVSTAVDSCP